MKKVFSIIFIFLFLIGCAADYTDSSIYNYKKNVQHKISLGDSKSYVLSQLQPLHANIPSSWLRSPERFVKEGKNVYIHFQRSARISDGLITDDEFTPYLFVDEKLTSIGWTALGGPKTFGQSNSNDLAASLALINLGNSLMTGTQGTTSSSYGASSATGFLTGETTSGFNKICYYNKLGNTYTLNVPSTSLCPLNN
ncbi:hypothetical protein [Candidatus Pelagibacter sp.]|uniref:hypothetical protein n=1 Tax=Candidatus Pelagibacter sp. TaxID=2024849 RepID=UPI003F87DD34